MNAINKPIPAEIAFFKQSGIAVAMYFLSPVKERIKKTIPERKMITRPDWYPLITSTPAKNAPDTNVVQKNALSPIPQACANGSFA